MRLSRERNFRVLKKRREEEEERERERDAMAPFGTLVVALLALSLVTTQGGGELVDNETDSLPPSLLQSKNTLVIVGSSVVEKTHSVFLTQLKKKAELYEGNVQVKAAEEKGVKLRQWGRWIYDSLVLLAPELNEVGGEKLNDVVLDFINSGKLDEKRTSRSGSSSIFSLLFFSSLSLLLLFSSSSLLFSPPLPSVSSSKEVNLPEHLPLQ